MAAKSCPKTKAGKAGTAKAGTAKAGKKHKMHKVLEEFEDNKLRSGSKKGPKVRRKAQAVAIALSESGQSQKKK